MKQNYTEPNIKIRRVLNSDVIATSDTIFFGDEIQEGTTEAPRRNTDWDRFEN